MNIMLLFSGVILANKEIDKKPLEKVTPIVEHYKIIPQDVIQRDKLLVAKKKTTKKKKSSKKTKKVPSKKVKKVVKKKKVQKKRRKVVRRTYVRYDRIEIQHYAYGLVKSYGWSEQDYQALVLLWYRESSWNPNAVNKKSGACGLAQANPCSKASKGTDYRSNWRTQVRWGLKYIANRYGSPTNAWKHSQRTGWY